jgi:hypothetical protein
MCRNIAVTSRYHSPSTTSKGTIAPASRSRRGRPIAPSTASMAKTAMLMTSNVVVTERGRPSGRRMRFESFRPSATQVGQ